MNYLVNKDTHQINLETWLDEDKHAWLERGVVCWNPDIFCHEGEEDKYGYTVVNIPNEDIDPLLMDEEDDLYWINDKVLTRDKVRVSFLAYISHPDFPDQRQMWIDLSNIQIADYQSFVVEEFSKFCAKYPEEKGNNDLWHDWLDDAFTEADFYVELPNAMNPVPAHVNCIDINHPKVECI